MSPCKQLLLLIVLMHYCDKYTTWFLWNKMSIRNSVHDIWLSVFVNMLLSQVIRDMQLQLSHVHDDAIKWKHFPCYWPFGRWTTGHRWIPLTKASDAELWCFFFICAWTKYWANNRDAGDLIRYGDDYDVTVMLYNVWIGPRRLCCVWIDNFVYLIWIYFTGATCDSGMMPSITPHLWHGDIPRTCPPRAVFHLIRRLVDNANSTPVPLLQKTRSIILQ